MADGPIMSSARICYLSPTRWCNLRECYITYDDKQNKTEKCKLQKAKAIEDQDRQRIYNWARNID